MPKLNGDGKIIVKLLSEKIDNSNKQINQRFDDFKNYQDNIIASFNAYKETTKQYIDEKHDSQQKLIDSHCSRIRALEKYKNTIGGILIAASIIISGIWSLINYFT